MKGTVLYLSQRDYDFALFVCLSVNNFATSPLKLQLYAAIKIRLLLLL